jgi:hypothetical protein
MKINIAFYKSIPCLNKISPYDDFNDLFNYKIVLFLISYTFISKQNLQF